MDIDHNNGEIAGADLNEAVRILDEPVVTLENQ